jgi:hypothetical protein
MKMMGMGSADYPEQSLEDWIRDIMGTQREERACTRIVLMHMQAPGDGREVWPAPVNGKSARELAVMFDRMAKTHAQKLADVGSGVQHFELWAFWGDSSEPGTYLPYPIKGKAKRDGFGTEGPSGLGPEGQKMRHLEGAYAQVYAKQAHLDKQMMILIEFLGHGYANALAENRKLVFDMLRMYALAEDKSHQHRMAEIRAMNDGQWKGQLTAFAPALMNTAFGKEIFPQGTADSSMLITLVETMAEKKPELLEMFVESLKEVPELHGVVAARVHEIVKKKNDKDEERQRALDQIPTPSAEDDALGGAAEGTKLRLVEGKGQTE